MRVLGSLSELIPPLTRHDGQVDTPGSGQDCNSEGGTRLYLVGWTGSRLLQRGMIDCWSEASALVVGSARSWLHLLCVDELNNPFVRLFPPPL